VAPDRPPPQPVKILHFYASPSVVPKGDAATVCYGVENAASVRLEPAVEQLTPSANRCVQVTPRQESTYRLIARGTDGREISESLTLRIGPPKPAPAAGAAGGIITTFAASATEVSAGQAVTLCYGVRNAQSVRIEPNVRQLEPAERNCFMVNPGRTTTYTLSATAGPKTEKADVTVRVR
jgi:hypothetical protein